MADTTVTYDKGKLYQLELAQLRTDPNQPRKYLDPPIPFLSSPASAVSKWRKKPA